MTPAEGSFNAKVVIIGEAPGENEWREGRPFVGGSGRVQDGAIFRAGLRREDCYLTNVLKCRPPNNDIHTPDALKAISICTEELHHELKLCRPKVVVPVGATALRALGLDGNIGAVRGSVQMSRWGKVIPTWHPAYIMRNWVEYDTLVKDWKKIARHIDIPGLIYTPERFNLFPSVGEIEAFSAKVNSRKGTIAVDVETYSAEYPLRTPLKMVGIAVDEQEAMCIPFFNEGGNWVWKTDEDAVRVITAVGAIMENPNVRKLMHHALFDTTVLMNHGFTIKGPIFDTMLAHNLVYHPASHALAFLVSIYTDYPPWKLSRGLGDDLEHRRYNARDCVVLHLILPELEKDLDDSGTRPLFDILSSVIVPTAKMSLNGIYVEPRKLAQVQADLGKDLKLLGAELESLAGVPGLNLRSVVQLRDVLFSKMKLRSQVKTGGGDLSTDEDVLKRLSVRYPENEFVRKLLDYRRIDKMFGTYSNPPISEDGRVHSSFKLVGPLSGRFASENPNLQNLPNKSRDGQGYIRRMYSAAPGGVIVEGDLSQVELRIFAQLADDKPWLEAFATGEDIHRLNAITLFGEYLEEFRRFAKNFIFGVIYGSDGTEVYRVAPLAVRQRFPSMEALVIKLWSLHPALAAYNAKIEMEVERDKCVKSPFGRTRWFVGKPTKEDVRSAINHPIQSTVADAMHSKFAVLDKELDPERDKIILQLHDAFYIETREDRVDTVRDLLKSIMEAPVYAPNGMVFQWPAETKVGPNLFDLK